MESQIVPYGGKVYLKVIIWRCRTWITWWRSCCLHTEDRGSLSSVCVCVWVIYIVSSPYLFVFDDDRVIHYMETDDVSSGAGDS